MDEVTTITELTDFITEYRERENLDRLDTTQELIKAVTVESGELLETDLFNLVIHKERVAQELADVLIYSFALADYLGFDVDDIIREKIEYNKKRGRKYD